MQGIIKMIRRLNIGYTISTSTPLHPTAAGEISIGENAPKPAEEQEKNGTWF